MDRADENPVRQLRVVVEADDYDEAVRFFRDVLGMPELAAFAEGGDDRVAILDAGRATLELASPAHKRMIDRVEADGAVSPSVRLAFEVDDSEATTDRLEAAGARVVARPVLTPWRSLNARLDVPAGLQVTLFQETETTAERAAREGFATEEGRDPGEP
ncbi:VOC family protein [Phycicoccus sonneratiae]|uniref:VOC family protein n=1 Tax=Phycicoccus sonneratiae TaxID=2807628 RepID=A0ABS2CFZ9_9MICO|nr:VOC family protein [Phycicoccus sonneraticus]MBM6398804.1 VOC family protein [Phycicoccus sonneraticus]